MKKMLLHYTQYNHWANTRICQMLEPMDESLLDREITSSFNSIRKTISHIWDAETLWYKRLNGDPRPQWPPHAGFKGDFKEFKINFLRQSQELAGYLQSKEEHSFSTVFNYFNTKGEPFTNQLWQMVMHCMNHSTYHRGQIITLLRNIGVTSIASTDLIAYFREAK